MESLIDGPVNVITCDGRVVVGILASFDQLFNLVLTDSHERIFSEDDPVRVVQLGLELIRGDNVAVVGRIDEDLDGRIDYESIRAGPIDSITYGIV